MSISLLTVFKCAKDDNGDYVNTTNTCLYESNDFISCLWLLFKAQL